MFRNPIEVELMNIHALIRDMLIGERCSTHLRSVSQEF